MTHDDSRVDPPAAKARFDEPLFEWGLARQARAVDQPRDAGHGLTIATWNVNSIRAREIALAEWLEQTTPDVACLQETKVVDSDFPTALFGRLGYSVATAGQRTYNGVAIASRLPMTDVRVGLLDDEPEGDRRLIAATVAGVRIYSCYVPNGRMVGSESFGYKLDWLRRLRATLEHEADSDANVVVCGDFNVAREDRDVFDPERMRNQLLFHPDEHAALNHFLDFGLHDAYRLHHPEGGRYSWWDYRAGSFRLNRGLRLDYVFVTRSLARRSRDVSIDAATRSRPKPSDHAPVILRLDPA